MLQVVRDEDHGHAAVAELSFDAIPIRKNT